MMALGCSEEKFWTLNPRRMNIYIKANEIKSEKEDYLAWLQGLYTYQAFSIVLSNAFAKKGTPPKDYPSEPISRQEKPEVVEATEEMSEEEKQKSIEMLFNNLQVMEAKFELAHGGKKR